MNRELATVLKQKLLTPEPLEFLELVAGMAYTVPTTDQNESGGVVIKRRPVAYDTNLNGNQCTGVEQSLIPNSNLKSVVYFEDNGSQFTDRRGQVNFMTSNIRFVCWMNRAKMFSNKYEAVSARCEAMVIERLTTLNPVNVGIFVALTVQAARLPQQDIGIFSRYTYTETDRQILIPPFEFFAIDFICKFRISARCLNETVWNNQVCY